ncbi:DUF2589 domain-containing protein [Parabacteroides sp. TM07-1AC]|jgi:hypothetical protein|uniref:DUF2589 domain-containing protein n=1 Tax=unclassified Parabacteroides TaxID=2649774 RepID=UPI000F00D23F|nr:DUF2589 domain-containing protein [Parabacteroides sp. TM07-1AC]RHU30331.1 DUF2589 domain-containing protein [Parabacteroides sp. TM07-1AC]
MNEETKKQENPEQEPEQGNSADKPVVEQAITNLIKKPQVQSVDGGNDTPAPNPDPQKNVGDSAADKFKGLPMRELIGGPLFAAAEAQEKLAAIALDYYNKIAFYGEGEEGTKGDTRILKFKLNRPVEQDGAIKPMEQTVEAPFIGLVPIPSLLIDRVDIDFQMEVTETNSEKSTSSADVSTNIQPNGSSRENTRSTNQTAKYQVHVSASQQRQTEGLSKLMDIMASCIEPIPASAKPEPDPKPES